MKVVAKSGGQTTIIESDNWYEQVKAWLKSIGQTEVSINDNCNEAISN